MHITILALVRAGDLQAIERHADHRHLSLFLRHFLRQKRSFLRHFPSFLRQKRSFLRHFAFSTGWFSEKRFSKKIVFQEPTRRTPYYSFYQSIYANKIFTDFNLNAHHNPRARPGRRSPRYRTACGLPTSFAFSTGRFSEKRFSRESFFKNHPRSPGAPLRALTQLLS